MHLHDVDFFCHPLIDKTKAECVIDLDIKDTQVDN